MRSKILQFIRKRYGSRGSALVAVALLLVVALVSKGQFYSFSNAQQHVIGQANTGAVYSLQGRATRVADGDTFTLRSGARRHTIRVTSIDAPETRGRHGPGQPFGQRSREVLRGLIHNKELDLTCYEQDHYGRDVCDVNLPCDEKSFCDPAQEGSTTTVSKALVKSGMAWANEEKRGKFLRDKSLRGLQQEAQQKQLGIWQHKDPIEPWVWRYQCWRQKQCK